MTSENQIRVLKWTMLLLWVIIAVSFFPEVMLRLLAEALVGHAFEKGLIWMLVRLTLLIVIPIAYFVTVRRLQWKLPPEELISDFQVNIELIKTIKRESENETKP